MKYCTHCGAEILEEAVICTKCGCWVEQKNQQGVSPLRGAVQNAKLNVCAIVGFILSMASIVFVVNFMGFLALAGMIVSVVGLTQIKNAEQKGKGYAVAGIIVGACLFLFGVSVWATVVMH